MSDSTIDNSSAITTIDVKEKKVVVEEAENPRVASANRNAEEGNAEQEANKVDEKRKKAGRKSRMWRKWHHTQLLLFSLPGCSFAITPMELLPLQSLEGRTCVCLQPKRNASNLRLFRSPGDRRPPLPSGPREQLQRQ
ncbi:Prothymosin Alpha [Manis pentadactyla]|nr:Prothymosin Alpha [Manis pentadactyla]